MISQQPQQEASAVKGIVHSAIDSDGYQYFLLAFILTDVLSIICTPVTQSLNSTKDDLIAASPELKV